MDPDPQALLMAAAAAFANGDHTLAQSLREQAAAATPDDWAELVPLPCPAPAPALSP
jgi:protein involved in temperature-dependent protein secretion